MIKATKRDGTEFYLNPDLIETIHETPDTHITLTNGNVFLVVESARAIVNRITSFKRMVFTRSPATKPRTSRKKRLN